MSRSWSETAIAAGANLLVVALMNGATLVAALFVMAVLPGTGERAVALIAFALAYLWATWQALARLAEDHRWTPFRRRMVYACGNCLTMMLLLEVAISLTF